MNISDSDKEFKPWTMHENTNDVDDDNAPQQDIHDHGDFNQEADQQDVVYDEEFHIPPIIQLWIIFISGYIIYKLLSQ